MKTPKPNTRTAATAPHATRHLTKSQQIALEKGGEAEHQIGRPRERLTRDAAHLGKK
jgi:hypothetical protein